MHTNRANGPSDTAPTPEASTHTANRPIRVRGGSSNRGNRSERAALARENKRTFNLSVAKDTQQRAEHRSETHIFSERFKPFCEVYEGDGYTDENGDVVIKAYQVDKSITAAQFLRILPPRPTGIMVCKTIQYDHKLRRLVVGTDERVLGMTDQTLLRRGNPFKAPTDIHRQTSISKRIIYNIDADMDNYLSRKEGREPGITLDELIEPPPPPPTGKRGRSSGRILTHRQ